MSQKTNQFNAALYKETTLQQWNSAAEAWHSWGPLLNRWLTPATETMLDMCGIGNGSRVLDVAAGAGEQTVTTAKRVGPSGQVVATDISPVILEFAAKAAQLAGMQNVETQVIDGEEIGKLESQPFDGVISRVGLIYFPDQLKAMKGARKKLKDGGKLAAMVYSTAETNPFFSIPVSIIRKRAKLPPPLPGQPGPFSLGPEGKLERLFEEADLKDIEVKRINAPLRLSSAAECLRFEQESFGALHQMLSGLSPVEQDDAWNEIETELQQFESDGQFEGPCEMVVAVGTK